MKKLLFVFSLFLLNSLLKAQPGCPAVDAGNNATLACTQPCTNLTANLIQAGATTDYTVSSIPYNPPYPFTGGAQLFINDDDIWGDVINLPFTFCFYGNAYTQLVIGANGLITFDLSVANNFCAWSYDSPIPTPGPPPGIYNNSINGAFHDIDPSVSVFQLFPPAIIYPANINYAVLGSAPCRTFVVNFSTVPHYDCNSLETTQQIVIYETTNIIEVYIKDKPTCSGWNDGNAVIGLQNIDGTQGITPPGRNTGPWSATNEAWRFTPSGAPIWSLTWYDGNNNPIGNTPTINVCPTATTTYRAEAIYTPCAGGTPVTVQDNVTITVTGLQASIDSSRNISCFGQTDGYASAVVANGVAPVTYGWSNGNTTLTLNNLAAGTYIFTATDAGNCTRRDTVVITQPQQLVALVPDSTKNNCSGTGTASFTATATGGTPPYSYSWNTNPVQTTQTITNVTAGSYTVTITDASGCTASDAGTLTVQLVNNLTISLQNQTDVSCYNYNDGSLTVAGANGATPYSYSWSDGQTTANATSLIAGPYTVTVGDIGGCTNTATYTITQPPLFEAVIDSFRLITCFGANDAYASVNITGGTAPVTTVWSTVPPQFSSSISNVAPGTYIVGAQDNNGCISSDTITFIEPAELLVDITASQNATCYGSADGSATATITGGLLPYNINWNTNPIQTTATASNVPAGFYTITVSDSGLCVKTDTVTITEPPAIVVIVDATTDVTCFGFADGSATVSASGGSVPYQYVWNSNPPHNTNAATNLAAGSYDVTATDAGGCSTVTPIVINGPAELILDTVSTTNVNCFGELNGAIEVTATGGTQPYNYQWTNPSSNSTSISQLAAGSYDVIVTDGNGCTDSLTIIIIEPTLLTAGITSTDITCYGYNDGTATITANGGTGNYIYTWSPNVSSTSLVSGLNPGNYDVTVTDQNGCDTTLNVSLTEPLPIMINLADTFTIDYGDSIILDNTFTGGVGAISFNWSPSTGLNCDTCQSPFAFPELTTPYTFTIVDETGCTATLPTLVEVIIDKTIYIPTAFTPNGDGTNDVFNVYAKDVSFVEFKVFDRWGEQLFLSTDLAIGWDGTFKGNEMPPAVFVYHVHIEYPDGDKYNKKGSFTLIR
jgi:gliding motility-associated-like protein